MSIPKVFYFKYAPVSDMQMQALEYLIMKSKDAQTFAKQVAIWLLRKSDNLSGLCCVHIGSPYEGAAGVAGKGFHDMLSSNGTTHLSAVMRGMNTLQCLSSHAGDVLRGESGGYTLWVHGEGSMYPRTAPEIPFNLDEIQAIEIEE